MSALTNLFGFLVLHLVIDSSEISLDLTDWIDNSQSNVIFPHDCLYVDTSIEKENAPYQIISYCMSEWSSNWNIEVENLNPKLTFDKLYQLNITSEQLYIWSAPLDVIERYQFFINQMATSTVSSSMEKESFFNCTLPRFGKFCQYFLDIWENHHVSLNTMIYNYYQQEYNPTELTCYIDLQCNHGSDALCLDWSQICDKYIDCPNGIDEKHCWQLEINECEDNEYQCLNGQCISIDFLSDDPTTFECLDETDEINKRPRLTNPYTFLKGQPTFAREDVTCSRTRIIKTGMNVTSSCVSGRDKLVIQAMFSNQPSSVLDDCWFAFKCLLNEQYLINSTCEEFCEEWNCKDVIQQSCPDIFFFPNQPVAFGHLYFAYTKNATIDSYLYRIPQYICYNDQLCGGFPFNEPILSFNNMTCRPPEDLSVILREHLFNPVTSAIKSVSLSLLKCNTIPSHDSIVCNSSLMYRCINSSKCISKRHVCDDRIDCTYGDDEQCSFIGDNCSKKNAFLTLFQCSTGKMCIHPLFVGDGICDCAVDEYGLCDDEILDMNYIRKQISFQTICDGSTELIPINIDGRNETDETECEQWKCDNIYTRCNGFWNCLNGMDELNCNLLSSSLINCPYNHHICVSPETKQLMCLSISKANDGNNDCLGATDEPILCRENRYRYNASEFVCTSAAHEICINFEYACYHPRCENGMHEGFCNNAKKVNRYFYICPKIKMFFHSDAQMFFCDYIVYNQKAQMVYFSLDQVQTTRIEDKNRMITQLSNVKKEIRSYEQRCHRGLGLHVWLNSQQHRTCLCPSNFYGTRCQYQNERVSLTLQFRTYSDSRQTLFALVILLIDNDQERTIHSYHQLTYLYIRHCKVKFNIYLIYSTRPKNQTKNYAIHIDIYEKITMKYRGSFLSTIKFNFLPVHRLALHLQIPRVNEKVDDCLDHQCIHGRCMKYSNTKDEMTFCQCDKGWSGKSCNISYLCTCSSDSVCIGMLTNNRSLCVCPINKWGSQCYLRSINCQFHKNETCLNGGTCIRINDNVISDKKFLCICGKGFSGDRCEKNETKLILTFEKNVILPEYILVHFIEIIVNNPHENGSTFKIIPINQNSVTLYWSRPFHVAFVQLNEINYYLIRVQKTFNQSETIIETINSANRCKYITEVFNDTLLKLHLLRRIKYYHLPCQNQSLNLSWFYDETYFCLCDYFGLERLANCFEFHSKRKFNCRNESNCENGAECLQDRNTCPQTSICVCPKCFYGTRCQFSSNLFGLSLDAILGYYIQPNISIRFQPSIVHINLVFTIIISLGGLINSVLCLITFKNKETCQTGSGLYLFTTSIITLLTIIIFLLKFVILLIAQIIYIQNRTFLYIQCYSLDYLLQVGLNIDRWLCACVAIERAIASIQGTTFNKKKSKQISKYMILIVLLLTMMTYIPDPIHRRLIDDNENDEERIWCIITYSSPIQIFNSIINIVHFFLPLIINILSPIIIIKVQIQQRLIVQPDQLYRRVFYEQCHRHNHLLIASVVLVILSIPRLIISFISTCLKSNNQNSWLFLSGYLISFIPLILHFILFVLPSKLFKEEFQKCLKRYRRWIQRHLHRTL